MRAVVLCSLALACGGPSAPAPPPSSRPPAQTIATPAGPNDVVVAYVDGKPVYGSCVAAQAARGATKQAALDECIGFELLAQRAQAFATDPEVIYATRTALVSQFIARDYEVKYTRPSDFGAYWDKSLERNRRLVDHGEARASAYLRFTLSANASLDQDAAAKALADELASKLADERGLTPAHLEALGKEIIGTRGKVDFAAVPPYLNERGGLVKAYADALFAIPEVGRTSKAVRTHWGWDIVLLSELIPAEKLTPEQVTAKMLPEVKRSYFATWARQVGAAVQVKMFEQNIPALEDL